MLRRTGNVSAAARAAGLPRRSAYALRSRDPAFAEDWAEAVDESLDDLEQALRHRALAGTAKPVFYAGKACGSVQNYSDQAGMFLLKAKRPGQFADGDASGAEAAASARAQLEGLLADMAERTGAGDPPDEPDESSP